MTAVICSPGITGSTENRGKGEAAVIEELKIDSEGHMLFGRLYTPDSACAKPRPLVGKACFRLIFRNTKNSLRKHALPRKSRRLPAHLKMTNLLAT